MKNSYSEVLNNLGKTDVTLGRYIDIKRLRRLLERYKMSAGK